MRRFILAFAAATVALGVTAASAADLGQRPVYKAQPAPVMAAYNWSGFYVGGHIGYAFGREDLRDVITGVTSASDPEGFLGGAVSKATGPGPTPTVPPPFRARS